MYIFGVNLLPKYGLFGTSPTALFLLFLPQRSPKSFLFHSTPGVQMGLLWSRKWIDLPLCPPFKGKEKIKNKKKYSHSLSPAFPISLLLFLSLLVTITVLLNYLYSTSKNKWGREGGAGVGGGEFSHVDPSPYPPFFFMRGQTFYFQEYPCIETCYTANGCQLRKGRKKERKRKWGFVRI